MRKLIIAPHVDDEVIGCWSVLGTGDVTVAYLYEVDPVRKAEALSAAAALGFTAVFDVPSFGDYSEVYVPSRHDWHADHKAANALYRQWATHFYSVDMGSGKLLADRDAKLAFLEQHYPSQASLWRTDAKYWLFEDIQLLDYTVYQTTYSEELDVVVTVVSTYAGEALACLKQLDTLNMHTIMDHLLRVCPGKVVVKRGTIIMESE